MTRYVAFLRAINVGGHNVTMERLRDLFTELGLARVETFIASGNVIFETRSSAAPALAMKIEKHLEAALGYDVATFLRTDAEVAVIAAHQAFPAGVIETARALNVGFLAAPLTRSQLGALEALRTDIDEFSVHGRELYWACRKRQSESTFTNAIFERRTKARATFRSLTTVAKLAARYAPE